MNAHFDQDTLRNPANANVGRNGPLPLFEDAACELCGSPPAEHLMTTTDIGWNKPGVFHLMRCTNCGLIITTPRPAPSSMAIYYEDWYTHAPLEKVRREQAESLPNRYICWVRLKTLEKTGPLQTGSKLLDVGAGFGVQLDYYIRHRGIRATGVDFDATTLENSLVRDRGELHTGDLLKLRLPADSFDVVTLYETLEHVYFPKATLLEAFRLLRPGGRLVVEVPDFGSPLRYIFGKYWFAIMVPVHLHHFTKASLRRMVEAAGFTVIRHDAMFVPFEASGSVMTIYAKWTRSSFYDVSRPDRVLQARNLIHLPFFLILVLFLFIIDLPVQAVLWLFGRTGAQTIVARKPY